MKCIDTPLLEDVLMGRRAARRWLNKADMSGEEICTTEVNMIELTMIARGLGKGLEKRLLGIDAIRREVTVLPIDRLAMRSSADLLRRVKGAFSPITLLVAASASAHGATHLLTDKKRPFPRDLAPLRLIRM